MNRQEKFKQYLNNMNRFYYTVLKITEKRAGEIRTFYADKYLYGNGIEIGAEANPLIVNKNNTMIKYVDRIQPEEISKIYNIPIEYIIKPDFISEADSLDIFPDNNFDFVVANHILEHMVNPIGAIREWLRILKDDGILFLSVPNFRGNEYDFCRKPVDVNHLIQDHYNHDHDLKSDHWKEFIEHVEGINPRENIIAFNERFELFREIDFRIHMHVFNKKLCFDILNFLINNKEKLSLVDIFSFKYSFEILLILRKSSIRNIKSTFKSKINSVLLLNKLIREYLARNSQS